jgi:membrane protein insertase Oxa1/YidC/SpoIIIJ
MLFSIWNDFLYQPLFNGLIWIYNNWTDQNLGWAVIYPTVLLRVAMIPLSIVEERNKRKNAQLWDKIKQIDKDFRDDQVAKKDEIRRIVKTQRVYPWAKAVALGLQLLVLVLLYQVFIQGITGDRLFQTLYPWIDYPGKINIIFFGFDIGASHDILWSAFVGAWLMLEIYWEFREKRKVKIYPRKTDLAYIILFPLSATLILWYLPMVKALFILTSMAFSVIIHQFLKPFFKVRNRS